MRDGLLRLLRTLSDFAALFAWYVILLAIALAAALWLLPV